MRYRIIPEETALLNDVPAGAYIVEVVSESTAAEAGIQKGDIITKLNGQEVAKVEGGLAQVINTLKVGESVSLEVYREGELVELESVIRVGEEE